MKCVFGAELNVSSFGVCEFVRIFPRASTFWGIFALSGTPSNLGVLGFFGDFGRRNRVYRGFWSWQQSLSIVFLGLVLGGFLGVLGVLGVLWNFVNFCGISCFWGFFRVFDTLVRGPVNQECRRLIFFGGVKMAEFWKSRVGDGLKLQLGLIAKLNRRAKCTHSLFLWGQIFGSMGTRFWG